MVWSHRLLCYLSIVSEKTLFYVLYSSWLTLSISLLVLLPAGGALRLVTYRYRIVVETTVWQTLRLHPKQLVNAYLLERFTGYVFPLTVVPPRGKTPT